MTLDLRTIPEAVADFFIVCDANATVQVKGIADHVEDRVKRECGELPYKHEGHSAAQWILIDYVNVVVHVFLAETRKFYRLEEMWCDGVAEEASETIAVKPRTANKKRKKSL